MMKKTTATTIGLCTTINHDDVELTTKITTTMPHPLHTHDVINNTTITTNGANTATTTADDDKEDNNQPQRSQQQNIA